MAAHDLRPVEATTPEVVETELWLGDACHHAVLTLHGPTEQHNSIQMAVTCAATGQQWSHLFREEDVLRVS